jgi:ATP-dependent Clp endopeptidase proteolytic subunit ClpP
MKFIEIENRAGKLKLNDGVYKESADKLIDELEQLYGQTAVDARMSIGEVVCSADNALESVEVEINSPGGSVFEGNRIYNALRSMSARGVEITTTVNGLAASMGSVILMAGDKRNMTKGSRVMIHEASTIAWGDARALRKNAELLEGISSEIAGIYAERTGGDPKSIRQLMLAETWMTAEDAKANGFIHSIIKDGKSEEFDKGAKGMAKGIFSIFKGDDAAADILAAAKSENETLAAELESVQAKLTEAKGFAQVVAEKDVEITDLITAKARMEANLVNVCAELETAKADIEAKTAEIETVKASVELKASELLAQRGHAAPVDLGGDDGNQSPKELSREAFNKLTPHARTEFSKAGGKIV